MAQQAEVHPVELGGLHRRAGEVAGVRLQQHDLVGESQVLQVAPCRPGIDGGVACEVRVVEQLARPQHCQPLQRAERQQVGHARQIGEVALQPRLLIGAQPLAAVVVIEREQLGHAAPGREVVERLDAACGFFAEQSWRFGAEGFSERGRRGDDAVEQGARGRLVGRRAQLGGHQRPQIVDERPSRQRLAHPIEKQDPGRSQQDGERDLPFVVRELHLVEDARFLLCLVDHGGAHGTAPGSTAQSSQRLPFLDPIEVDVPEIGVQVLRERGLAGLTRTGEYYQPPLVSGREPRADPAESLLFRYQRC